MPKTEKDRSVDQVTVAGTAVLRADSIHYHPQRELFTNWSARIPPGFTLVGGGEGTCKTTLLRLLAGVLPAQHGRLVAHGVCLGDDPVAYRQQVFRADPRSDAHDQVTAADYFKSQQDFHRGFDLPKLAILIEGLSLTPHLGKPMYMLSTGSKRKVWLAAAFAAGAAMTLLDEPFAVLDNASVGFVLELLEDASYDSARGIRDRGLREAGQRAAGGGHRFGRVDPVVGGEPFVMETWKEEQHAQDIYFLPDGNTEFSTAMGMQVDKSDLGMGKRSWRYAMLVRDGMIEKMFIEPEEPGDPFTVSDADTMLNYLTPQAVVRLASRCSASLDARIVPVPAGC